MQTQSYKMKAILNSLAIALLTLTTTCAFSQVTSETNVVIQVNGTTPTPTKWNGNLTPLIAGYGETAGSTDINLMMASKNPTPKPACVFKRSRGTLAAPGRLAPNDQIGSLAAFGYDGTAFQGSASADFFADSTPAAGVVPIRFTVSTGGSSAGKTERFRIGSTGDFAFNTNQLFLKKSNGRLGLGTLTPGGQLELSLDQARKPSTSTWTITSDARLKRIDGNYKKGLEDILKLKPISYHYKNTEARQFSETTLSTQQVGFTAQDVQKVFPEAVTTDEDGYLALNIHPILIASINAFKDMKAQIDAKDNVIASQQKQLDKQQAQIDYLMQQFTDLKQQQVQCCTAAQARVTNQTETITTADVSSLQQNAPNPFNNSTVIRYHLASAVRVGQLVVTDVKGATLKTITLASAGEGQVTLNAGTLTPGAYFYTLLADGRKVDTKEMQIMK